MTTYIIAWLVICAGLTVSWAITVNHIKQKTTPAGGNLTGVPTKGDETSNDHNGTYAG